MSKVQDNVKHIRKLLLKQVHLSSQQRMQILACLQDEFRQSKDIIILPCSDLKATVKGKVHPSELYRGPLWTTYNKYTTAYGQFWKPGEFVPYSFDLFAMSAKFGLISNDEQIRTYDKLLGRDVTAEQLVKKIKAQSSIWESWNKKFDVPYVKQSRKPMVYAFTSRDYTKVLLDAGVQNIHYVKGGIGTKRKHLITLLSKGTLPKSQLQHKR